MEQKVGFSLCLGGHAEMVVNGAVCTVEAGTLMLRTPLFLYLEMECSNDYAECELMMPMAWTIQPMEFSRPEYWSE